jgi:hypothetical protein
MAAFINSMELVAGISWLISLSCVPHDVRRKVVSAIKENNFNDTMAQI